MEENIECGGFTFFNNFDSANLAQVEQIDLIQTNSGKPEKLSVNDNNLSNVYCNFIFREK